MPERLAGHDQADSAEFEIPGYDAEKGPTRGAARSGLTPDAVPCAFHPLGHRALEISSCRLVPSHCGWGLSGVVYLSFISKESLPNLLAGRDEADCGQVVVKSASLKHDGIVLASGRVGDLRRFFHYGDDHSKLSAAR